MCRAMDRSSRGSYFSLKFGVHLNDITKCKAQILERGAADVFDAASQGC